MPDLAAMADRFEITDLLLRYGRALDTRDSALLETCFTNDAVLAYDGSPVATRAEFVERAKGLTKFVATHHMITNILVELAGDRATSTSYAHAQHVRGEAELRETYLIGGTYTDELARTNVGWRITHRRFVSQWVTKGTDVLTPLHERLTVGS